MEVKPQKIYILPNYNSLGLKKKMEKEQKLVQLCKEYHVNLIAIGNGYWEQVSGIIDNSDEIEELEEKRDELEEENENNPSQILENEINEINEQIEELESEQDDEPEAFQWFIVDDWGARLLQQETNEIVYYNDTLDIYLWGVTLYCTSWDYVLTNIKIDW